jgi:acyl dehydratase
MRYLEDFAAGQKYESARIVVSADKIRTYASEFDPQPFHLDEVAARDSIFGSLAASGWHTASLTMGLLVRGDLDPAGGFIGAGVDELRWPGPVRPGDELHLVCEVLETRESRSRPTHGLMRVRVNTLNQRDETVQTFVATLLVQRRPR